MDIQVRIGIIASRGFWSKSIKQNPSSSSSSSSSSSYSYSPFKPLCSRRDSQQPQKNGDNNNNERELPKRYKTLTNTACAHFSGDKYSTDWDKAWSSFKKRGKKTLFSEFSPDKYVTWNPKRSNYPLSEEVDPIKRTERSNLMLWTSPRFTLYGAIIIVTFLLIYAILYPAK